MVIYSCRPSSRDKLTRAIILLIFVISLAMMIYGSLNGTDRTLYLVPAFGFLMVGSMLCYRYVIVSYIYSIERENEYSGPDLVIRSVKPGKTCTVCRVSIADGRFLKADKSLRDVKKIGKIHNFNPGIASDEAYWFISSEAEGSDVILFTPDKTICEIISGISRKD